MDGWKEEGKKEGRKEREERKKGGYELLMRIGSLLTNVCSLRSIAMALISVTNVTVLNNPAGFCDPFQFEITFECEQPLQDGLFPEANNNKINMCLALIILPFVFP